MVEGHSGLESIVTWKNATYSDLPPGRKPIPTKMVFDRKTDENGELEKFKIRLVVIGSKEKKGVDFDQVFSPVANANTIRLVFAWAFSSGRTTTHIDVKQVFTQETPLQDTWVLLPPQLEAERTTKKLIRNLYDTHKGSIAYHQKFCDVMAKFGFTAIGNGDQCVLAVAQVEMRWSS